MKAQKIGEWAAYVLMGCGVALVMAATAKIIMWMF